MLRGKLARTRTVNNKRNVCEHNFNKARPQKTEKKTKAEKHFCLQRLTHKENFLNLKLRIQMVSAWTILYNRQQLWYLISFWGVCFGIEGEISLFTQPWVKRRSRKVSRDIYARAPPCCIKKGREISLLKQVGLTIRKQSFSYFCCRSFERVRNVKEDFEKNERRLATTFKFVFFLLIFSIFLKQELLLMMTMRHVRNI